jgi:hypothetical protein
MIRSTGLHIIRIYEQATGYSLYAGCPSELSRHPLDLKSNKISQSYLSAQGRLDEVLDAMKGSWSMTFRWDGANTFPIVAYGGYIELPVENGQSGIVFLHAVELAKIDDLCSHVNAVITHLSNSGIRKLRRTIVDVAVGRSKAEEQANQIAKEFDDLISTIPVDRFAQASELTKIKCVEQDCAGASSVAWFVLAIQQAKSNPPWEVFDLFRRGEHLVTTVDTPYGQSMLASEIQRQSLRQYLQAKSAMAMSTSEPIQNVADDDRSPAPESDATEKLTGTSDQRHSVTVEKTTAWPRLMPAALLLTRILVVTVGLYLVYSLSRQHRDILNILNRIVRPPQSSEASAGNHVNSNANVSAPATQPGAISASPPVGGDDREILNTIATLYDSNQRRRVSAINQLRNNTTLHERIIPLALTYAKDNQNNHDGLENTLIVLQSMKSETLKRYSDEVLKFLTLIGDKNPSLANRVNAVRRLVTGS